MPVSKSRRKDQYRLIESGEWIAPTLKDFKVACCDCGLVHTMQFRMVKAPRGYQLQFTATRDNRATAQIRRKKFRAGEIKQVS